MTKIKARESQNVEYKSSWHDKYLEWICGFANAQGAVMYFGVNNDHEVIGLENVDKLMEDIPNKIVTTMGIVVDVNLLEQDGLDYIEVVIEPSNIPINYKGKYYYRSGSTMQELRGPALQQFVLKKMGRSWDDITNDHATIEDLDRNAIDYFLRKGFENGRISDEERNAPIEVVLENLNLVNEEGKLKNAALLLFAKKPQRYFTCVPNRWKLPSDSDKYRGRDSVALLQKVVGLNLSPACGMDITIEIQYNCGHYEAGCLDWSIFCCDENGCSFDGEYDRDDVDGLVVDALDYVNWRESYWNPGLIRMQSKNIEKKIRQAMAEAMKEAEDFCRQNCTGMYGLAYMFSNGEAGYTKIA